MSCHSCNCVLTHSVMQVFYAMCQGLLYALCYHLDTLLNQSSKEDGSMEAAQLQHTHISSDVLSSPGLQHRVVQDSKCPSAEQLRQQLSDMLPIILRHRSAPPHQPHLPHHTASHRTLASPSTHSRMLQLSCLAIWLGAPAC